MRREEDPGDPLFTLYNQWTRKVDALFGDASRTRILVLILFGWVAVLTTIVFVAWR